MDALRTKGVQQGEVEAFEDVEHLERSDALAGRWYLVHPDAPVVCVDRLYPEGLVSREVLFVQVTASFSYGTRDAPSDLTSIKSIGPIFSDGSKRPREVLLVEELAGPRSAALQQKSRPGGLVPEQKGLTDLPVPGYELGDGVALLGELPGGLQEARERQVAQSIRGVLPEPDRARNRDGETAALGNGLYAPAPQLFDGGRARGAARSIHTPHVARLGLIEE